MAFTGNAALGFKDTWRSSLTSAGSRAQIDGSYLGSFRKWRRNILCHVAHELTFVVDLESLVEPALEANRGHRFTAQESPTNRARIGPRQNFQIIRQRFQLLHHFKQRSSSLFRAGGQLGSS